MSEILLNDILKIPKEEIVNYKVKFNVFNGEEEPLLVMSRSYDDILGWIGMVLVLIAYGLLSTNKIPNGKLYQILNLIAAIFMAIGLFPKNAWFSFALQVAWALIGIIAIIKIIKNEKK